MNPRFTPFVATLFIWLGLSPTLPAQVDRQAVLVTRYRGYDAGDTLIIKAQGIGLSGIAEFLTSDGSIVGNNRIIYIDTLDDVWDKAWFRHAAYRYRKSGWQHDKRQELKAYGLSVLGTWQKQNAMLDDPWL
ncbi:MAG: hypothetical protein OHK0039_08700 [Bacteroidia bacterium]